MYVYQKSKRYFAQIAGGLEDLAVTELLALGAENVTPGFRGAFFQADQRILCRVNYTSRLISRVLAPLKTFQCRTPEDIYRRGKNIKWPDFFRHENTFAVFANVSNSTIRHSKYAALRLKDAVADAFRARYGRRPNIDTTNPDVWLNLYIENNRATINLDTSGGPLHRRGYRKKTVEAPMRESLAAVIIKLSEWDGATPIHDPMCGSGTLVCEALMKYCRIPSGVLRKKFGFEFMPDFEPGLWKEEKRRADGFIRALPSHLVFGSDVSEEAVSASKTNVRCLKGGQKVNIKKAGFEALASLENAIIVCNPPYGIRLKQEEDLGFFYKRFGDFLKRRCTGSTAYIYFGNREMIKKIGLRPSWKKPLKNGALDGRLVKYELY